MSHAARALLDASRPTERCIGELIVHGHPHGIRNGWFLWPVDFDPVWLLDCNGYEAKKP